MNNTITLKGIIVFDPENKTNKHKAQSIWKKVAMVSFSGDICEYYIWLINRRYNLKLNQPLRNPHVTFINDREADMNHRWEEIKKRYNGMEIDVVLDVDLVTDSNHWWFDVPEEHRKFLHDIRAELGLDGPYFGLHLTIGYVNEQNKEHANYVHKLMIKHG